MSLRLSDATDSESRQPVTRPRLIEFFHGHQKTTENFRIGAEFEKFLVGKNDGLQRPYRGGVGVDAVMVALAKDHGWTAHYENEDTVGLTRDVICDGLKHSTITLEPGGQIELATPPCSSLRRMESEVFRHRDELRAIVEPLGTEVLSIGISPFSAVEDIAMTDRLRHKIMADYLPKKGKMALHMMKATASIQAALDYSSEADASRKLYTSLTLSPIVTALFANSPYYKGEDTGMVSYRGRVWQHTDNQRSGLLDGLIEDNPLIFERWTDFLLDMPMMFFAINDQWEPAYGTTFRHFMDHGHRGFYPTLEDWEIHLTSVFPEVRLKQFVEVRGADAVEHSLAMGFPALWKGIFYDDSALSDAYALAQEIKAGSRGALFEEAITKGLKGAFQGRSIKDWCQELLTIASRGLKDQGKIRVEGNEAHYLDRAFEIVESGMSPADHLRAAVGHAKRPDPAAIVRAVAF